MKAIATFNIILALSQQGVVAFPKDDLPPPIMFTEPTQARPVAEKPENQESPPLSQQDRDFAQTEVETIPQIDNSETQLSEDDLPLDTSTTQAEYNNVGETSKSDNDKSGFYPFELAKPKSKEALQLGLIVVSVFTAAFCRPFWAILAGIAPFFLSPSDDVLNVYETIYGRIEQQISSSLKNKNVATMVSKLNTLSDSLKDNSAAYLSMIGMKSSTEETIQGLTSGKTQRQFVLSADVDVAMTSVDQILSGSETGWYYAPANNSLKTFILTGVVGLGDDLCFHTKDSNIKDQIDMVVDKDCDLGNLGDKTLYIEADGTLMLNSNSGGTQCLTYHSRDGKDTKKHLAAYHYSMTQCDSALNPHVAKLRQSPEGYWSIYADDQMLCIGDGTDEEDLNVIVSPKRNGCKNGDKLEFQQRITVLQNPDGPGETGYSTSASLSANAAVSAPLSFDEIGVQVLHFPQFAGIHLASFKERYLHGSNSSQQYSKEMYNMHIEKYRTWMDVNVPVFEKYAKFMKMDAEKQLAGVKEFYSVLSKANLLP